MYTLVVNFTQISVATLSCSTYITEHETQTVGGPLGYCVCGCCTGYAYAQLSYSKHFMMCVNQTCFD